MKCGVNYLVMLTTKEDQIKIIEYFVSNAIWEFAASQAKHILFHFPEIDLGYCEANNILINYEPDPKLNVSILSILQQSILVKNFLQKVIKHWKTLK